jgi:hypothetical protein
VNVPWPDGREDILAFLFGNIGFVRGAGIGGDVIFPFSFAAPGPTCLFWLLVWSCVLRTVGGSGLMFSA